ncbi:MAG: ABC transporter substrate-binding protein [Faecalibacterium sp.]|nr:ABC transporter substrate-binding protein [Ruminococcus sp.]MCM1392929.1 ABC transporter substrate-binding protein [Ruminococcus sp.]MCM1485381.1 ABC transporter substrate-binding protein [Faecalibacterium sp.]
MKKAMKWLSIVLCVALVLTTFAACGDKTNTDPTTDPNATVSDAGETKEIPAGKVYNVGICQLTQHVALDAATKGFMEKLTEMLGEDHVKFNEQNAAGDSNTCATIVNQFVSSNVDLILANATPALQAAVSATDKIPIVGTSITDYATALEMDVDSWTGKTGINVTGTADLAPLDKQADMFDELLPNAKTIGLLYCSGEANSKFQINAMKANLEGKGLTTKEYTFADSNDIAAVVTKAVGECDAIYVPTDNKAADNTEIIANIAEPAGIPIIAGEEGICEGCGIATLSISYYDIGVAAAEIAYDILVNGTNAGDIEIGYSANLAKKYVKDRCDALKITVPEEYVAIGA